MPDEFIIYPAYGRDYKSLSDVRKDWDANKDFMVAYPWNSATYINKSDYQTYGNNAPVWVRFNSETEKEQLA